MLHTSIIKRGLLLSGSLAIAYNLSVLLHELCHLIPAYFTGGRCGGIYINPFSWSYSSSSSPYPLLTISAGPFGSAVIGLILFFLIYRWYRAFLLPFFMAGPISLLYNSGYLLIDILMQSGGDACSLVEKGVPQVLVIIAAMVLLVAGLWVSLLFINKTGLLAADFKGRLMILSLGIVPYLAAIVAWNYFYNRSEIMLWLAYAGLGTVFIIVSAAITFKNRKMLSGNAGSLRWREVVAVDVLAMGFVVFLLIGPLSGSF